VKTEGDEPFPTNTTVENAKVNKSSLGLEHIIKTSSAL